MCHYKVRYSYDFGRDEHYEWHIDLMDEYKEPSNFQGIPDLDGKNNADVIEIVPTFCLQDILELLPKKRMKDNKLCLDIRPNIFYSDLCILYMDVDTNKTIISFRSDAFIDAAYDMLCWCIENGYIKTK